MRNMSETNTESMREYTAGDRVLCGDSTGTVVASVLDEGVEVLSVRWDDGEFSRTINASMVELAEEHDDGYVERGSREFGCLSRAARADDN